MLPDVGVSLYLTVVIDVAQITAILPNSSLVNNGYHDSLVIRKYSDPDWGIVRVVLYIWDYFHNLLLGAHGAQKWEWLRYGIRTRAHTWCKVTKLLSGSVGYEQNVHNVVNLYSILLTIKRDHYLCVLLELGEGESKVNNVCANGLLTRLEVCEVC